MQDYKECYKDSTKKANMTRSKQSYEKILALVNLPNLVSISDAQKNECLEEDTIEQKFWGPQ